MSDKIVRASKVNAANAKSLANDLLYSNEGSKYTSGTSYVSNGKKAYDPPTKYGVTSLDLNLYRKKTHRFMNINLKDITRPQAEQIHQLLYKDAMKFDFAVNQGAGIPRMEAYLVCAYDLFVLSPKTIFSALRNELAIQQLKIIENSPLTNLDKANLRKKINAEQKSKNKYFTQTDIDAIRACVHSDPDAMDSLFTKISKRYNSAINKKTIFGDGHTNRVLKNYLAYAYNTKNSLNDAANMLDKAYNLTSNKLIQVLFDMKNSINITQNDIIDAISNNSKNVKYYYKTLKNYCNSDLEIARRLVLNGISEEDISAGMKSITKKRQRLSDAMIKKVIKQAQSDAWSGKYTLESQPLKPLSSPTINPLIAPAETLLTMPAVTPLIAPADTLLSTPTQQPLIAPADTLAPAPIQSALATPE